MSLGENSEGKSPDQSIEDGLWQLSHENPECRDRILELINFMRSNLSFDAISKQAISHQSKVEQLKSQKMINEGQALRSLREANNQSLRGAARNASISPSLISEIELGRRRVTANNKPKLAEAYGISVDELDTCIKNAKQNPVTMAL